MKDNRKRSVAVIAAWCALAVMPLFGQSADGAYEIGEDLALSLDKWERSADDFIVDRAKNGFRFSDNRRRDTAVCRTPGAVMCFGESVMETRVYFRRKVMERVELFLENLGRDPVPG